MPAFHFSANRRIHLRNRFRLAFIPQEPDYVFQFGAREKRSGPEKNTVGGFFHSELGARLPGSRYTDALR